MSNAKAIPVCVHFRKGDNFIQDTKFTLTEQLTETENVRKATLKLRLKLRQDFSILKLDTLSLKGLNQELNNVLKSNGCFYCLYFTILLQLGRSLHDV